MVWLRIFLSSLFVKCQRSLAHTRFMEYLPVSWQKTVSIR